MLAGSLPGPAGGSVDVDLVGHGQRVDVVAVGVEEAGQKGLSGQVDDLRGRPLVGLLDRGPRTDGEDLPVLHRERLGGRLFVVHGDDIAAHVDRVGDLGLRLRREGGHEPGCPDQCGDDRYVDTCPHPRFLLTEAAVPLITTRSCAVYRLEWGLRCVRKTHRRSIGLTSVFDHDPDGKMRAALARTVQIM